MTDPPNPSAPLPSGAAMPLLGFGTWQITGNSCYDAVRTALDVGYRHLDSAMVYRNEEEVGRALRDSGVARDDVFVTTKVPPHAEDPRQVLETSLQKLGTDHLDLWLIHWTEGGSIHEDLWQVLLDAQKAGKVRDVGVSNYSLDQLDRLTDASGQQPAVNQIEWAPTLYDAKVARGHAERGVVLEGYSALKNTDLDDPVLREIAESHGVSTAQVLLRWHLDHGFVAIPKSVTPERIEANFAVTGFSLTPDEVARIDGLAGGGAGGEGWAHDDRNPHPRSGPDRVRARPRLHGHEPELRPRRPRRVDRDDPPGPRPGRHVPRHLGRLRQRAQRGTGRRGDCRPPRRGPARDEVLADAHPRR